MARILIIGIGEYSKEINKHLKDSFSDHTYFQFNFSFLVKDPDEIFRLYQTTLGGTYRCISSDKSPVSIASKISKAGFDQVLLLVGNITEQKIAEVIIYILAHLKKSRIPASTIIIKPFHIDEIVSIHNTNILFQFLKMTFGNVEEFNLEDFHFLYRNDSVLTMKLIAKEIAKIIEDNLQL
ncbi:MAG TPA: hypothetical protein VNW06_00640 [Cytophagaceae bacterium]|nr:hypothetical protein [Cytophagaceae bacterium]